jgi:hypothetical protein
MRALSLRQPWAAAVLHIGKHIENRRWYTPFRGEFLIHAAKGMTRSEYDDARDYCEDIVGAHKSRWLSRENLVFGGIVGRARLVDVIRPCDSNAGLFAKCSHPWHMPEQFGFVLEDVQPLPFVPCKGALGFFEVPDDVVRAAMGGGGS